MATKKLSKPARQFQRGESTDWLKNLCLEELQAQRLAGFIVLFRSAEILDIELETARQVKDLLIKAQLVHKRHWSILDKMQKKVINNNTLDYEHPTEINHSSVRLSRYVHKSMMHLIEMDHELRMSLGSHRDIRSRLAIFVEDFEHIEARVLRAGTSRRMFANRQIALIAIIKDVETPQLGETFKEFVARVVKKVASARLEMLNKGEPFRPEVDDE